MNDDMELIRDFALRQSEPAFETLVSRYVNLVYSAALRQLHDPHLAEEITQAVFVILARKAARLGPRTILPSWLYRTTRYAAADAWKAGRRREQRERESYMLNTLNATTNKTASGEDWGQIAPLLDGVMNKLGERDHAALVLRFFENRNFKEVGVALGTSENAAKMRVNRALERLRKLFSKQGIHSTTAIIAGAISSYSVQVAPVGLAKTISTAAIAKSATASVSTITLMKGAMKVMAWTKANTAIAIGVAAILAAGTTVMMIKHQSAHVRLPKPQPVGMGQTEFPKAGWHFAGYTNPESDFMSCMWAVNNGDNETLLASVSPAEHQRLSQGTQIITAKDKADYAKMTGYQIIDKQVISEDKVILVVETAGQEQPAKFLIERIGGEWKFAGKP